MKSFIIFCYLTLKINYSFFYLLEKSSEEKFILTGILFQQFIKFIKHLFKFRLTIAY